MVEEEFESRIVHIARAVRHAVSLRAPRREAGPERKCPTRKDLGSFSELYIAACADLPATRDMRTEIARPQYARDGQRYASDWRNAERVRTCRRFLR